MILGGLAKILNGIVMAALMLFPNWEPPQGSPEWSALSAANIVLPLDTWAMLSGATVAAMGASLLVWVIMKALNLIRGAGA